jgi:hypothetical protein
MTTTKRAEASARRVADRARSAGRVAKERLAAAADAALVKAGHAAKRRQRSRTLKSALKTAGKAAIVAGATAASVIAGRAAVRAVRQRGGKKA